MKDSTLFNKYSRFQCWGSGSGSYVFGLPDPHPDPLVTRIRLQILPASSKNSRKNVDFQFL